MSKTIQLRQWSELGVQSCELVAYAPAVPLIDDRARADLGEVRLLEISSDTYDYLRSAQPAVAHRLSQVLIRLGAARLRNILCRVQEGLTT